MSRKLLLCVVILFLGIVLVWRLGGQQREEVIKPPLSTQTQESKPLLGSGIDFEYQKATSTSKAPHRAAPDLSRPLSSASTSTRIAYAGIVARLKTYPNDTDSWIALGLYRKESDDYKGAEEAWKYASALSPADPQPYDNLGVLYGYYLHNNALAEQNILTAIEKAPLMTMYYLRAVEFYREVLKDTAKARSIVEQGLKLAPQNSDLLALRVELK